MAYPSKFTASYDYSAFAQGQGDNSFPGQSTDTDIANIKATVDDIIDFLKTPLASDGTVKVGATVDTADIATAQAAAEAAQAAAEAAQAAAATSASNAETSASNAVTTLSTAATVTFNGATSARLFGGVLASSITITEVKA